VEVVAGLAEEEAGLAEEEAALAEEEEALAEVEAALDDEEGAQEVVQEEARLEVVEDEGLEHEFPPPPTPSIYMREY
jgi:antirestriction protein